MDSYRQISFYVRRSGLRRQIDIRRPSDGWAVPEGKSVIAEVYPALWTRRFDRDGRDGDEHAAYATAARLQRADMNGSLGSYFKPPLTEEERSIAAIEGWILGVV